MPLLVGIPSVGYPGCLICLRFCRDYCFLLHGVNCVSSWFVFIQSGVYRCTRTVTYNILLWAVMDHLDDHDSDDMEAGVSSDGDSRFWNKKRSKIWDMYKPVTVNGGIRRMECRYCHANFSCTGGYLWRHHKNCKAKEALGQSQQQHNADLGFGML